MENGNSVDNRKPTSTVAYITDENYVDYTLLSVKSLLKHAAADVSDICIVCHGVSDSGKKRLAVDDRIRLVDYSGNASNLTGRRHVSNSTFIKFDLPNILDVDSCLYLDGDVIVVKGIGGLLGYDTANTIAGVVKDFGEAYLWPSPYAKRGLSFNCGVMLMDLKAMREGNYTERLYAKRATMPPTGITDQEVFNSVCIDKVSYLPCRYNLSFDKIQSGNFKEYRNIELFNRLYGSSYKTIDEMIGDAAPSREPPSRRRRVVGSPPFPVSGNVDAVREKAPFDPYAYRLPHDHGRNRCRSHRRSRHYHH